MKLLLSFGFALLGLGLVASSSPALSPLAARDLASISTGGDGGGGDPIPLYWICKANQGNCQDCVAGTKCSKNLALRLCKLTTTVSECSQTVHTDCGTMTKYANLDCTGTRTNGGACTELTCP